MAGEISVQYQARLYFSILGAALHAGADRRGDASDLFGSITTHTSIFFEPYPHPYIHDRDIAITDFNDSADTCISRNKREPDPQRALRALQGVYEIIEAGSTFESALFDRYEPEPPHSFLAGKTVADPPEHRRSRNVPPLPAYRGEAHRLENAQTDQAFPERQTREKFLCFGCSHTRSHGGTRGRLLVIATPGPVPA